MSPAAPPALRTLLDRFDPAVLPEPQPAARVRLEVGGAGQWDAVIGGGRGPRLEPVSGRAEGVVAAPRAVWDALAADGRTGLESFRAGKLKARGNMHLVIGLLAATSGADGDGRLRMGKAAGISYSEAGVGDPVLLVHGLGASKVSFLTTQSALADRFRMIALDMPGFGDSDKPLAAAYDPKFMATRIVGFLDALGIDRAHVVGNSLGGRIALEVGFRFPERTRRLALLAPSLAWLSDRPWAPLLRLVRPELGLLQPAPRAIVEPLVRRLVPGAHSGWTAAGVDEFLRGYLNPRGRAAFYAAARNIYLENPGSFWPRLEALQADSLFVWGRRDPLVPHAFMKHVERALPQAEHLELDCGHVPQLERPRQTHDAVRAFLSR